MNLKFLGRWSSNLIKNERNISFILDDKIVFDFGPHTIESLLDLGIDPAKIEIVAITHTHLDHFGGLPELFWYRSIYKASNSLVVLGPGGIRKSTEGLLKLLGTPPTFNTEFDFIEDEKYKFITPFRARHTIPDNGYRIEYGGKSIFYSGDTAYSKNVVKGAENVDYLLHEMTYPDERKEDAKFWKHSTYSDAIRVLNESRAKRLIPVHLTTETLILARKGAEASARIIVPDHEIKFL